MPAPSIYLCTIEKWVNIQVAKVAKGEATIHCGRCHQPLVVLSREGRWAWDAKTEGYDTDHIEYNEEDEGYWPLMWAREKELDQANETCKAHNCHVAP